MEITRGKATFIDGESILGYVQHILQKQVPLSLVTVQDHHLGLSLSNALDAQHITRIDPRNERSVSLSQHRVLSTVESDLGASVLAHGDVNIHVPVRCLLHRVGANSPLEPLVHADYTSAHDEVCMDGDCVWERRFGSLFRGGVSTRASLQRGEDGHERDALGVFVEGAGVVARSDTAGPW
jgi:hypothetical protein